MYQHNINSFDDIVTTFKYWYSRHNKYAKPLLQNMGVDTSRVKDIKIREIKPNNNGGRIMFDFYDGSLKKIINRQNLRVQLVSNEAEFNQISEKLVETYQELWNIPKNVVKILKHFTGELPPYIDNTRDPRRMFVNEFTDAERAALFDFLKANQLLIVSDILKGRGKLATEWMLVIVRNKDYKIAHWALKSINVVCNYFGNGEIEMSPQGSVYIGKIRMQRKGGDGGRPSANMLQFNIDPTKLIDS
ncbi:MAG: type II restriction endonuclease [Methylococcales symbiont of Hymedesmia sp. n. MRB-2018]|nr:MAG: type II restriction endonuclease [Methylococcales symbiont of Hymedesmia sp. n. MRB-2018]